MAEDANSATHASEATRTVDGSEVIRIIQADTTLRRPVTPLSPLTHIAIFASILAPTAIFPYLAVRRHLLSLRRTVAEVRAGNAALQRELRTALLETSVRREEHDRLRTLVDGLRRDMEKARADETRKELSRARFEEKLRREVEDLFAENEMMRNAFSHMRDLSPALADIAAFMHEVEVHQGFVSRKNDGRGIERIRQLAYRLQGLPWPINEEVQDAKQSGSDPTQDSMNAS